MTTDAEGRYQVTDVPAGSSYIITARRIGFLLARRDSVALVGADTVVIDLVLSPVATELADVKVKAPGSSQTAHLIGKEELDRHKTTDPFTALFALRPGVLRLICGSIDFAVCRLDLCLLSHKIPGGDPTNPQFEPDAVSRCSQYVLAASGRQSKWLGIAGAYERSPGDTATRADPNVANVGRMFNLTMGTNGCPMVDRVVVDSQRIDIPGVPIFEILETIPMEAVDSIALVDCWDFDYPSNLRNAIWVYGHGIRRDLGPPARQWFTFGISGIQQLEPLAEMANTKIALSQIGLVSIGYQARLSERLTGRLSIGQSFVATRHTSPIVACEACGSSDYAGGSVQVAQLELTFHGPRTPIGFGFGLGLRRYSLPSGADDGCIECQEVALRSQTAPFVRPVLRLTMGRGEITTVDFGPYLSRFRGSTMVDLSLGVTIGLAVKHGPSGGRWDR